MALGNKTYDADSSKPDALASPPNTSGLLARSIILTLLINLGIRYINAHLLCQATAQ